MNYHRLVLLAAIATEVTGTSSLKMAADDPVTGYLVALGLLSLSLVLFSVALRAIPVAAAYALWEGLGIVGLAAIGYFAFGEPLGPLRLLGLATILAGICLLLRGTEARAA
ncbi:multidrug efflux SMR transporter [Reyranella sp. CPCC 100927]|uniref:DMT family transporter n=1 Tax=Reyranella sp. CPCC 100927 TaxID=2599616 RepID=UPI0015B4BF99|nr:SMR family transporter [Reyranella sp. CPCC 100927]